MNAHPNPEEMFARAKALKKKFYAPAQPTLTHPQRTPQQQREHVHAYRAWQAWTGQPMTPKQYFEALCWLSGYTPDVIRSHDDKREKYAVRKSIMRSMVKQYPYHSRNQIGQVVNRDHTTVLYAAGKLKEKFVSSNPDKYRRGTTPEDRRTIRRLYKQGMSYNQIAPIVGFSSVTVSKVVRDQKW